MTSWDETGDQYDLLNCISGGMFKDQFRLVVWDACDNQHEKAVEARVASMRSLGADQHREYLADLVLTLQLDHKNLARFTDVFSYRSDILHILPNISNQQSLHELIVYTSMTPNHDTISNMAWQLLSAVDYLHGYGAILPVIPLKDIMVDVGDAHHVVVNHFGYKSCIGDTAATIQQRSPYCYMIPGVTFCAPEIMYGSRRIDEHADSWCVGAVMAALLAKAKFMDGNCDLSLASISSGTLESCLSSIGLPSETILADMDDKTGDLINTFTTNNPCFQPKFLFDDCIEDIEDDENGEQSSELAQDLVSGLLAYRDKRLSVKEAMNHRYFHRFNNSETVKTEEPESTTIDKIVNQVLERLLNNVSCQVDDPITEATALAQSALPKDLRKIQPEKHFNNASYHINNQPIAQRIPEPNRNHDITNPDLSYANLSNQINDLSDDDWKTFLYHVLIKQRLEKPQTLRSLTETCLDTVALHYDYDTLIAMTIPKIFVHEYNNRRHSFLNDDDLPDDLWNR